MIKEFLKLNLEPTKKFKSTKKYAFICDSINKFNYFLDLCDSEGIDFTDYNARPHYKRHYYEYLKSEHIKHLSIDSKKYFAIIYIIDGCYHFYSRDNNEDYYDWYQMEIIDFTQILRDFKLNELGI